VVDVSLKLYHRLPRRQGGLRGFHKMNPESEFRTKKGDMKGYISNNVNPSHWDANGRKGDMTEALNAR
jgi:hypothetical protein